MATKKTSSTTKEVKENIDLQSSQDITKLLEMMQSMQAQFNAIQKENETLKSKIEEMNNDMVEITGSVEELEPITIESVQPFIEKQSVSLPSKIKVYHMQELHGGLATYIKLTKTTRTFSHMGQVMNLNLDDFEELESSYRRYFDKGVLALDADAIDIANIYNLPIYDPKTKTQYNAKVLKDVVNYNYDKLQQFYNSLSENNKVSFLNYWLGQAYEKVQGFYDMEKLRWLNSISGMEVFNAILLEMENKNRRSSKQLVVDGDKV